MNFSSFTGQGVKCTVKNVVRSAVEENLPVTVQIDGIPIDTITNVYTQSGFFIYLFIFAQLKCGIKF